MVLYDDLSKSIRMFLKVRPLVVRGDLDAIVNEVYEKNLPRREGFVVNQMYEAFETKSEYEIYSKAVKEGSKDFYEKNPEILQDFLIKPVQYLYSEKFDQDLSKALNRAYDYLSLKYDKKELTKEDAQKIALGIYAYSLKVKDLPVNQSPLAGLLIEPELITDHIISKYKELREIENNKRVVSEYLSRVFDEL